MSVLLLGASPSSAEAADSKHKLRGSAEIKAIGVLEKSFKVEVDMAVKRRGSAVELVFSFKGHSCRIFGKSEGRNVVLDADQSCAIEFSEKGYDVELVAKLTDPIFELEAGHAKVNTRFYAEGTVAHDVTLFGLSERVSMPVAGGGTIALSEVRGA